jgi:hypothetical protein
MSPRLLVIVALSFGLAACAAPATVSPQQVQTEVALALAQTQAAFSPTPPPPSATPTPAATATPRATATPGPTRTPRPTATPNVGSLKLPYPLGEEITLTYEAGGQRSEFSFQVLEVIRGDEANLIVKRANMFNDDPPGGASWMLARVRVTLLSGAAYQLRAPDVGVISGGQIFAGFASVCCTEDRGYPLLDANIAAPGVGVEGWVIRPVLLTDDRPVLALGLSSFQPDLNDGLYFALYD